MPRSVLTPVSHDPFALPYQLAPVDGDPFADVKAGVDYVNSLPPPAPYGLRELAQDPSQRMLYRAPAAIATAVGDQIGGLARSAWGAATLPGDVATGKVDPGSQEALQRSTDLAGMLSLPSVGAEADPNILNVMGYHGTDRNFDAIDLNAPTRMAHRSTYEDRAAFFATTPREAQAYGERIIPADIDVDRGKTATFDVKHLYENDPSFLEKIVEAWREQNPDKPDLAEAMARNNHAKYMSSIEESRQTMRSAWDAMSPEGRAQYGEMPEPTRFPGLASGARDAAMKMAREQGLDTAIIRNLNDTHGTGDQIVVMNPNNMKFTLTPVQGDPFGASP